MSLNLLISNYWSQWWHLGSGQESIQCILHSIGLGSSWMAKGRKETQVQATVPCCLVSKNIKLFGQSGGMDWTTVGDIQSRKLCACSLGNAPKAEVFRRDERWAGTWSSIHSFMQHLMDVHTTLQRETTCRRGEVKGNMNKAWCLPSESMTCWNLTLSL